MLLQLILTNIVNPTLLNLSRSILKNSQLEFISSMFKERQFNDTVEGLTIFINEKTEDNIYKNIFIRDESTVLSLIGSKSSTIFAKSGYITEDEKNLVLMDGNIHKLKPNGDINIVKFKIIFILYCIISRRRKYKFTDRLCI